MNQNLFDIQIDEIAAKLEWLGRPYLSAIARQRIWQKARSRAIKSTEKVVRRRGLSMPFLRGLASALVALAVVLVSVVGVSAQSLPGDALYPLARGFETIQLTIVPASQRAALELQILDRRAVEMQELVRRERPVPPEIIAEIAATVDRMVEAQDFYGGAAVVEAHLALQEETLRLVVAQYPELGIATVAFASVSEARSGLQILFTPRPTPTIINTATPSPSPTPGPEPGQELVTPTPPALEDRATPPGQEQTPPGQEQTPPGQEQTPPGQEHTPPGQEQTPPGQEQTPPGQEQTPPGQEQTPPGQEHTPPGQEQTPPGQEQTPPGQEQTPPGQGQTPPGQEQTPPGQEKTPPGQGKKP